MNRVVKLATRPEPPTCLAPIGGRRVRDKHYTTDQEGLHMKIAVTASGTHLDAPISPIFGRCPTYLFVDAERMACEAIQNPATSASAGTEGVSSRS